MRRGVPALIVAVLLAPAPAFARVVNYDRDEATFATDATELKIEPVAAPPSRGRWDINVDVAPEVDHSSLGVGMYCSAYKVENPISDMVRRLFATWDRDGSLATATDGTPRLKLRLASARTTHRCVQLSEFNTRCITRVMLAGDVETVSDGATQHFPVSADVERNASIGGFCGDLARGIGVITRQAGIALIADISRQTR